jgi:hypothetical protein
MMQVLQVYPTLVSPRDFKVTPVATALLATMEDSIVEHLDFNKSTEQVAT